MRWTPARRGNTKLNRKPTEGGQQQQAPGPPLLACPGWKAKVIQRSNRALTWLYEIGWLPAAATT